jgi:hypothetical protein
LFGDNMKKHDKPKDNVTRKREKGGPAIADLLVALRLPIETRQTVLAWAKDQPDQPNLSEALRRLVEIGLGSVGPTPPKPHQAASREHDNEGKAVGAGAAALTQTVPAQQTPTVITERVTTGLGKPTRDVRWTPRIVKATLSSAPAQPTITLEPQPTSYRLRGNGPYQMPEDLQAFNEYWTRAEHGFQRRLSYEEVIVLFNQDRAKTLE